MAAAACVVLSWERPPTLPADPDACDRPNCERSRALGRFAHGDEPERLSSRTISPVSVIQAVVFRPANSISTRNAGIGAFAPRTISRSPTVTVTGAFRSVAGSNTFQRWIDRRGQPAIGQPANQIQRQHGPLAQPPDFFPGASTRRDRKVKVEAAHLDTGDRDRSRAGIQRKLERLELERAIHPRSRLKSGDGVRAAKQRHLQLPVFLQLEALVLACVDRDRLAYGETDFFAAVVNPAPLRRRTVAREVGRDVAGGVHVADRSTSTAMTPIHATRISTESGRVTRFVRGTNLITEPAVSVIGCNERVTS